MFFFQVNGTKTGSANATEVFCEFDNYSFTTRLFYYVSDLVWEKLDCMLQFDDNNGDHIPQIGPLLVDMQIQQRHILAGILKVSFCNVYNITVL